MGTVSASGRARFSQPRRHGFSGRARTLFLDRFIIPTCSQEWCERTHKTRLLPAAATVVRSLRSGRRSSPSHSKTRQSFLNLHQAYSASDKSTVLQKEHKVSTSALVLRLEGFNSIPKPSRSSVRELFSNLGNAKGGSVVSQRWNRRISWKGGSDFRSWARTLGWISRRPHPGDDNCRPLTARSTHPIERDEMMMGSR